MAKRRSKDRDLVEPSDSSMVCVVPKQNVEILGRALHSLARIGDELYLEPLNGGLTFRTVHANHSVYAEVHFSNQFFSYYQCPDRATRESGDDNDADADALKCRINMKSYLAAFRSLPCIRKQVETCLLRIEPTWLMVKFRCHHDLIRTYKLPVIETETLQALYTVEEVPNHLVIGADVFATAVKNFQLTERDITLEVEERSAILRNYVPGGTDPTGVLRSELKLESGEFVSFTVRQQTSITFCLKSFRAVLHFSEPANLPLAIKFSSPGSPVVVISDTPTVELRFVLSSLAPEDCDTSRLDSQQLLTPLPSFEGADQQVQVRKKTPATNKRACSLDEAWEGSGSNPSTSSTRQNPKTTAKPTLATNTKTHHNGAAARIGLPEFSSSSAPSQQSHTSSTGAVVGTSAVSCPRNNRPSLETHNDTNRDIVVPESDHEEEEEENDFVPASPPAVKKARILFQRCYDPTLTAADFDGGQVYAPDSDEGGEDY